MDISSINNYMTSINNANFDSSIEKTNTFQHALESAAARGDEAEIKKACLEFETYFLQVMFREMRKTSFSGEGIFSKSNTEEIFQDMLDEEISRNSARAGGIGLADMMYKQITLSSNNKNTV